MRSIISCSSGPTLSSSIGYLRTSSFPEIGVPVLLKKPEVVQHRCDFRVVWLARKRDLCPGVGVPELSNMSEQQPDAPAVVLEALQRFARCTGMLAYDPGVQEEPGRWPSGQVPAFQGRRHSGSWRGLGPPFGSDAGGGHRRWSAAGGWTPRSAAMPRPAASGEDQKGLHPVRRIVPREGFVLNRPLAPSVV